MADDSLPTEALLDGRYRLRECVGQGGMARVYRADDVLLGRTVAIKLLRSELDGASSSGRARSEMTVLASLNHPALVTLYDAQLSPGRAEYLVMEFVDGPTLSARIAQGPMPPAEAAVLAADLAEALHVVHGAGVVHRDIKPSNVLMSGGTLAANRSGAKLADFGISVLVDAARLTSPGVVIGTAAYIAPEQMKGAPPAPPADIYSLGLVLLEALTAQRAFANAEGIGAAMARLIETPEVPEHLGSGWSSLLHGMLASDPAERPTAAAVFAAVSELAHGTAAAALPTVPAGAAAAALAAGGATAPVPAATAPEALTATHVLPLAAAPPTAARSETSRKRRLGILGGVAAAAVAASVAAGALLTGGGAPEPQVSNNPVDTEQSPAPSTTPADVVPADDAPVAPVEDTQPGGGEQSDPQQSKDEQKAAEEAAKKAEQEQKKAEQEQKKAEEEAEKNEEEAQKDEEPEPTSVPTPEPSTDVEQQG